MTSKLTIYKPEYPGYAENPTYENNCREMMGIWRENGWVDFSFISGDYLWADKEQTFLLWDRARIDDRHVPPFVTGLFANTVAELHPRLACKLIASHVIVVCEEMDQGVQSSVDTLVK